MDAFLENGPEMTRSSRLQSLFHPVVVTRELLVPSTYVILVTGGHDLLRSFQVNKYTI